MSGEAAMKENHRLLPIDALRGTAMFFVGISHISYYILSSAPHLSATLRALGFFATPNFLLMSGLAVTFQTYFESQSSVINSLSR